MDAFIGTFSDYKQALYDAMCGALRHLSVAVVLILYFVIMAITKRIVEPLGFVGGIIMCTVRCACISSYLYLLREIVSLRSKRIGSREYLQSFLVYLRPVTAVVFAFFVASLGLRFGFGASPNARQVFVVYDIVTCLALNVVAEVIYVEDRKYAGMLELFSSSVDFIRENWLEWFTATFLWFGAIVVALVAPMGDFKLVAFTLVVKELRAPGPFEAVTNLVPILMRTMSVMESAPWASLVAGLTALLGFHMMMIFRGFLFKTLSAGSRRKRAWLRRVGS